MGRLRENNLVEARTREAIVTEKEKYSDEGGFVLDEPEEVESKILENVPGPEKVLAKEFRENAQFIEKLLSYSEVKRAYKFTK